MKQPHDYLKTEELLAQLGEEAGELVQAALKERRTIIADNPTPVKYLDAHAKLLEEAADVLVCFAELFGIEDWDRIADIKDAKTKRWVSRLEAARSEKG